MDAETAEPNPLLSENHAVWDRLIEAVNPASLLVVIEQRLGDRLRQSCGPEDVWQEALLHAWRDRRGFEWRGIKSFRSWLLSIIDNRIMDLADRNRAQKRGSGRTPASLSPRPPAGACEAWESPAFQALIASTTPSRVAIYREQAAAMHAALAELPDELREIVRLRLFDQLQLEHIAERLNLGLAAVRHRFRKGAELYYRTLKALLASRGTG